MQNKKEMKNNNSKKSGKKKIGKKSMKTPKNF